MSLPNQQADWARLFRIACALIRQVNSEQFIIDHWTLGGGTAMMLQIDHRESQDVDIFLSDPQLLSFLDPQKRDFQFEIWPAAYEGDGTSFQKLAFDGIGEIDFIVGRTMTPSPTTEAIIEGETTLLETIPEIIAKKIYHRGSSIKPRDIFDIAAAGEGHADIVVKALRPYRSEVQITLGVIERLNPEFVSDAIAQLAIKDKFRSIAKTALKGAKELLRAV
ncbi:MAG TPA: nucleotidyl transferase AbiEii/AbiGii toxin family protein [Bradyrhizobium sp.]|nr:nucleotidyl transferase AbiEii/AbiGii toxin family protein [Bradyrhizobium sp.]